MNSFTVQLPENRRTLESVTFPDGSVRPVRYMRDGIILFADKGPVASYERSGDSVTITPITNGADLAIAAMAYRVKVGL